jgi:chorismate mutase
MALRETRPHGGLPTGAANPEPDGRTITEMRAEIDEIDSELVRLIQRRSEISHAIGAARASEGGTRIVYSREMKILDRFAVLGPAGTELGMLLLSLGRGQLGRK